MMFVAAMLALAGSLAHSDAHAADAGNGRALAEKWCVNCHLIGSESRGGNSAPPFTAIAANPDRDSAWLQTWLSTTHETMPEMPLTRRDIDDLVAYIQTLAP